MFAISRPRSSAPAVALCLLFAACGQGSGPDFSKVTLLGNIMIGDRLPETSFAYGGSATHSYLHVQVPNGFYTYDVGDGTSPRVSDSYGMNVGGQEQQLVRRGPNLYYRDGAKKVHVFGLADPGKPQEFGLVNTIPDTVFAYIGQYVYAPQIPDFDALKIYDATDPVHPMEVGSMRVTGLSGAASLHERLLLLDATGLGIYDATDRAHPKLISHVNVPGATNIYATFPSGHAWTIGSSGVETVAVEPAESAHIAGKAQMLPPGAGGLLGRVSRDGRYWFLVEDRADGRRYRTTWDMSDPAAPKSLQQTSTFTDDPFTTQMDERFLYETTIDRIEVFRLASYP